MEITKYTVNVNAEKPFRAFHMSDNHICLADGRDNKRKTELAERRETSFAAGGKKSTTEIAAELLDKVREENALLLHTGDLIDFVSRANLDCAKRCFEDIDVLMCAGNHEFSLYVGEAWEDEAYKAQSLADVTAAMPKGILFGTREINGVRFITLDNSYYYILPKQYEKTKAALSDGKPCVLLVHTPLYSKDTYEKVMRGKPADEPPYLCGCPDELLKDLSEHRFKQQRTDKTTAEFLELCNGSANLKAVITGHIHRPCFSYLDGGVPQYAANGAYYGAMNEYLFI